MTIDEFDEQWAAIKEMLDHPDRDALLAEAQCMIDQINTGQVVDGDRAFADRLQSIVDQLDMDYTYDAGKWVLTEEKQVLHFDELAQEILAQLDAIEVRSGWIEWPFTTVASSTAFQLDASTCTPWDEIVMPGYHAPKKPIRTKVRYTAPWRKEQIERKLRRL